jgi:cytochrome c556
MTGWFPAGTGPDVGETRAKPDIWQDAQDFSSKLHDFQIAAQAFDAAARSGDVDAIKARGADLGGACKACHDKYRAEEKH